MISGLDVLALAMTISREVCIFHILLGYSNLSSSAKNRGVLQKEDGQEGDRKEKVPVEADEEQEYEQQQNKEDEKAKPLPTVDLCRSTHQHTQTTNLAPSQELLTTLGRKPGCNTNKSKPSQGRANVLEVVSI